MPVQLERTLSEWIWKVPRQRLVQAEQDLGTAERAGLAKFGENIQIARHWVWKLGAC